MSDLARRAGDTGVTQHRHNDGSRTWHGTEVDLRRALDMARRNGRLADAGELEPIVNVPGAYVVRVRLVEKPPGRPSAIGRLRRHLRPAESSAPWWVRWGLIGAGGLLALGVVAWVLVEVLHALALLVPIALGLAVVLAVAWLIAHIGGGGGGSSSGGSFGGIYISQNIRIGR